MTDSLLEKNESKGIQGCIKEFYGLSDDEQATLLKWCKSLTKSKDSNVYITSYGLKRIFAESLDGFYVTSDQFNGAMLMAGFRSGDYQSMNWDFNVRALSVRDQKAKNNLIKGVMDIKKYGSKYEKKRMDELYDFVIQESDYIEANIESLTRNKTIGKDSVFATRDEFKGALLYAGYEPEHASYVVWKTKEIK